MAENVFAYALRILPQLMEGVKNTLSVYLSAILPALAMGLVLGILISKGPKFIRAILRLYTWAWRGTPLLLQLLIMKFGFPAIGIQTEDFLGSVVVFMLNMGAYVTEIMRASIGAVDPGQYEACAALCIPKGRTMLRIIIPQTIRIAIPPACSEAINLIKDTALLYILGYQDMLRVADQICVRDKTIVPFVMVFLIYLLFNTVMVLIFNHVEKRVTAYD